MIRFASLLRLCLIGALALVSSGAAQAAHTLGDAGVAYRADRVLTVGEQTLPGTLYAMPGRQRHEQLIAGLKQVAIFDFDSGRGYFIVPALSSYLDFPIGAALRELGDPDIVGAAQGKEDVNGVVTIKYRIAHRAVDGTRIEGFVWLSADGIPMRGQGAVIETGGKRTPVSWELSNIRRGPQDPTLFSPPKGYYRLPAGALPSFLGGTR